MNEWFFFALTQTGTTRTLFPLEELLVGWRGALQCVLHGIPLLQLPQKALFNVIIIIYQVVRTKTAFVLVLDELYIFNGTWLGLIIGLFILIFARAVCSSHFFSFINHAVTIVADLEMPCMLRVGVSES